MDIKVLTTTTTKQSASETFNTIWNACDTNSTEDVTVIDLGVYYMLHLTRSCENCNTTSSPQWRKGWHSHLVDRKVDLCNACGLKFNKDQCCPYCFKIFENRKGSNDDESVWCSCVDCSRKIHVNCVSGGMSLCCNCKSRRERGTRKKK